MWRTKVAELLGIEFPIIEGGMAIPGNGALAAAVSNGGGLGMVGFNPGWTPPHQQLDNLRRHIREAKSLTDRPFAVNIPLFYPQDPTRPGAAIDIAAEEGVKIVSTSGGDPRKFTKFAKDRGMTVIHLALNVAQARKAEQAGVDIIVASGYEGGGVLGPDEIATIVLVPMLVEAVSLPVVAAGGIADGRGFVAALALGAQGIQMGTRFLATAECHIHSRFKEAIVSACDTDTFALPRPPQPKMRSLKTQFTLQIEQMERGGASPEEIAAFLGPGRHREGMMEGDVVSGDPLCGTAAGLIRDLPSATTVVRRIAEEAAEILTGCNKLRAL